jgi:Wadjet protein JetD, C-terminal
MVSPLATARRELLHRLLEQYERGRSFGRPAPWRRDIIMRLDARHFPAAFHPDGREALSALRAVAEELARDGAVRLVRHRGYAAGVPQEVRIGPDEIGTAYRLAEADGFEPLTTALATVQTHARALRTPARPDWMNRFLALVEDGATAADLSALGMARDRLKRERHDLIDALTAAAALAAGDAAGWERVVSERLFGHSKRLGAVRARVVDLLIRADPRWDGITPDDTSELLEAYGVRRKPGVLHCAGRATLRVAGRCYRLEDFVPTAHLPGAWAAAWVEALSSATITCITSIENEFPFFTYVEEAGGPEGLGARGEVAVYTAGFPAPVLADSLAAIARRDPAKRLQHWGDADAGGLRIWWLLRARVGRPVSLLRTTADWVTLAARQRGTPLDPADRAALQRLREPLMSAPCAADADVREAIALIDVLLALGVKVEQERY